MALATDHYRRRHGWWSALAVAAALVATTVSATPRSYQLPAVISDGNGGSRTVCAALPLADKKGPRQLPGTSLAADGFDLLTLPPAFDSGWHRTPSPQLVLILGGTMTVTTADGASTTLTRGDGMLFLDQEGAGHRSVTGDSGTLLAILHTAADGAIETDNNTCDPTY